MEISMKFVDINSNRTPISSHPASSSFSKTDSVNELEKLVGLSDVKKALAEITDTSKIDQIPPEIINKVIDMYQKEKLSLTEIGNKMNMEWWTVRFILKSVDSQ